MKIGSRKTVNGKQYECVGFLPCGAPKWVQPKSARLKQYTPGEEVKIVGLMPGCKFDGVIVSTKPLLAKITTQDPVWEGCEITSESNLRKVKG